jgi:predicted RNA-binding Zn ribbon-like protein
VGKTLRSAPRVPQPVHPERALSRALDERELLEEFLSLHDHAVEGGMRLEPDAAAMAWWLRHDGGLPARSTLSHEDVHWALSVRDALRERVDATGHSRTSSAKTDRVLDEAVRRSGLVLQFRSGDTPLRAKATGVGAIVGRLLATVFLAELHGTWPRFRICANPGCRAVFFDHSDNRSAKWCSMRKCGNRHKVRAFRERQRAKS